MALEARVSCLTPEQCHPSDYETFLDRKSQMGSSGGFAPTFLPDFLFDFQAALVDWSVRKGRAAIFADTGTGKTIMELVWAENIIRHTNGRVLLLTPLAVGAQMVEEGYKFGIAVGRSRDGTLPQERIVVTNYEQLGKFDSADFAGTICDESSIIKHQSGATQKQVNRFLLKVPYRLLATATAAPNDYVELGTSSEALGYLGHSDMLTRFFIMDDKKRTRMNDVKLARAARGGNYYQKLSYRVAQQIGAWRLKGHAEGPFWQWVCSWAKACRKPSDLGFDDGKFLLPEMIEREHTIEPHTAPDGMLFTVPAFGLQEERDERRRTLRERCAYVAKLCEPFDYSIIWCDLNPEGELLEELIPYAIEVAGKHSDNYKEAAAEWFKGKRCICDDPLFRKHVSTWEMQPGCRCGHKGGHRRLVSKGRVFGFGLNFQICHHVVTFATHSYEKFYQSVRRCYRFGQTHPVTVDIISTTGEVHVRDNMRRKSKAADVMFTNLVRYMNDAQHLERAKETQEVRVPGWL